MRVMYCQYCGGLLLEKCRCQENDSHLFDFLLVEYADKSMPSYSEERALLEYAEHRMG